jgi:hypothetical protein
MRYALFLLFGTIGVLLLFLARHQYEAVNLRLAGWGAAQGIVRSVKPNGDLNLAYRVESTDYEVVRSVAVNFFPRFRAGDTVNLVYDRARPDTAKVRQWSVMYQDTAVVGGFGLVAILAGVGALVMMGGAPSIERPAPYTAPTSVIVLDHPIEIRETRREFYTTLVVAAVLFVIAFLLFRNPGALRTRWVGYPAASVVLLVGIGIVWGAFYSKSIRIRADQDGLEIKASDGSRKFVWAEVGSLKRETVTQRVRHTPAFSRAGTGSRSYIYTIEEVGHYFILLDNSGREILKLDEDVAMEPLQDWLTLRAFIPQRTGLPVQQETRKSPLGEGQGF